MKTYNAMVIGCGRIGCGFDDDPNRPHQVMTHAGAYASHARTKLVALVDVDKTKLDTYGKKYGVKTYTDAREALAAEKPDIVSICTLMDSHLALVKAAVAAGVKAIWCEKPLAPTAAEGREIERACKENNVVLVHNFIKRFDPVPHKVKELVPGIKPVSITSTYTGGMWNNGIHAIDLLRLLLGEITSVTAKTSASPPRTPADPNIDATLTFASGLQAELLALDETNEAVTTKGGLFKTTIEGTNGSIALDHWNISITQGGKTTVLSVRGTQDYMRNAVTSMIAALEQNTPVPCTAQDGWKAVAAVNALLESAKTNKSLSLPEAS